jgi:hypothetical protein
MNFLMVMYSIREEKWQFLFIRGADIKVKGLYFDSMTLFFI